ncbi:hypothetical protein KUTeg_022393 [Tegillarca granosa]|uniref:Uncharacterized protein n=1 Tax=Tegillarca granosa TaxID=220873 RepID=A0ABQ9E635_TEGGR|nr:hypothetical protein KUTeg_022393 [Tegillarca granosa]
MGSFAKSKSIQCIYKIPSSCLAGHMTTVEKSPQQSTHSSTLLAPLINGDRSPSVKRSPLLRTKCLPAGEKEKDRHDSSSSDSGITILRPGGDNSSPPQSPYQKCISQLDYGEEQETELI